MSNHSLVTTVAKPVVTHCSFALHLFPQFSAHMGTKLPQYTKGTERHLDQPPWRPRPWCILTAVPRVLLLAQGRGAPRRFRLGCVALPRAKTRRHTGGSAMRHNRRDAGMPACREARHAHCASIVQYWRVLHSHHHALCFHRIYAWQCNHHRTSTCMLSAITTRVLCCLMHTMSMSRNWCHCDQRQVLKLTIHRTAIYR